MAKTRLTTIAKECDIEFDEALKIAQDKLPEEMITGKGKGTWINEEGSDILKESFDIPEIVPKHYKVKIFRECPNRMFNWGHIKEIGKKIPVLIPRRFWGKLIGKFETIECIKDDKGETYRYVHKKRNG